MKKLLILVIAAAALLGAAYLLKGRSQKTPNVVGHKILPAFNISDVTRVEITGAKSLTLASGEAGWTVDALHGYPADGKKILDELLKLKELKAGQPAAGISNAAPTVVILKDAAGKELAKLEMGEQHRSAPRGEMAQFGGGGYPDGRYVAFEGTTVVVNDALDAFNGDPKKWVDTKIGGITASDVKEVTYAKGKETVKLTRKDSTWTLEGLGPKEELDTSKTYSLDSALSYLNFSDVVDPKKTEAEHGHGLHRHAEERHHLHRQGRQQDRRRQRVQGVRRLQARRHERHRERRLREDGQGLQRQGWQVDVHDLVLLRRVNVQNPQRPREGEGRAEEGRDEEARDEEARGQTCREVCARS